MEKYQVDNIDNVKYVEAIHKDRWVSLYIKIQDYHDFVHQFIVPFSNKLEEEKKTTAFYYKLANNIWSGDTYVNVAQLNFFISPFELEKYLKPYLFNSLNKYFSIDFLSSFNIKYIEEGILEKKKGFDGLDLNNLKFIGLEEFYIDDVKYFIGYNGGNIINDLYSRSFYFLVKDFRETDYQWKLEDAVVKGILLEIPILHSFINNSKDRFQFLQWVTGRLSWIVDQEKLANPDSSDDKDTNYFFQEQKEYIMSYCNFLIECLDNQVEFEESWLNAWVEDVVTARQKMKFIFDNNLIPDLHYNYKEDPTLFHDIDEKTYRIWQSVYYMLRTVSSQLSINNKQQLDFINVVKDLFEHLMKENDNNVSEDN